MTTTIRQWLVHKWRLMFNQTEMQQAYFITYNSPAGMMVLQHMLDNVYCTVCESNDPIALAAHNAQRAVVHNILQNIDLATNPLKYQTKAIQDQLSTTGAFNDAP